MRGRPTCPTEQEKKPVGATAGRAPFSTRKGWVQDRPLIRPGFAGPPSPQGEGFRGGCAPFRLQPPPLPARPAGGRAVTSVRYRAAGQAKKEGGPPQGLPKLEKVGPGRKNLFLPGVLSPDFLQRKSGSPAVVGGAPRGAAPQGGFGATHP